LRGGYINAHILDDDNNQRWCTRLTTDRLGLTANQYFAGTTRNPKVHITGNIFKLLITTASYPKDVTVYFVGEPYKLATTETGSKKTSTVTTSNLNVLFHEVLVLMAEVQLRRLRGTERDFAEAKIVQGFVDRSIASLINAGRGEPQTRTAGQFRREADDMLEKRLAVA
jgi:hypothetical protein